jgi:hydroxymethylpyrimidine pyrophosphatase-like HAD family hydrolase
MLAAGPLCVDASGKVRVLFTSAGLHNETVKLRVLALDYDGTIAQENALDGEVRSAISDVRKQGLVVVLVTGRIISELRATGLDLRLFDAIVAENGAMLVLPQAGRSARLAPTCSTALVEALRSRDIVFKEGECIVELDASLARIVLEIVAELQLPLVLHFNRQRLMVLPQAVSKATGLREALRRMRLSAHNAIGVGDAENDHELISVCELGAAVAWATPALRAVADVVIEGGGPPAVAAFIRQAALRDRLPPIPTSRRDLILGRDTDGAIVSLGLRGRNILIAGDPRSGKSWIGGLLSEQLVMQGYSLCVIDPEGDYQVLEALPGVITMGGEDRPPTMHQLTRMLRHADNSVVVDLSHLDLREKRQFTGQALRALATLRTNTGLPHRIVVDEAHYFLHEADAASVLDLDLAGYMLITCRVSDLNADILRATECVIITHESDATEARLLHELWQSAESVESWQESLGTLELDEVMLLPPMDASLRRLKRIRLASRLTHHVRHRHKYMDVPVSRDVGFRFVCDDGRTGPVACSLQELVDALANLSSEQIRGHAKRGDMSRWLEQIFHDDTLARRVREFEQRHELGTLPDFNGAVMNAVQERYGVAGVLT